MGPATRTRQPSCRASLVAASETIQTDESDQMMWTYGLESLGDQIHLELVFYQVGKPKLV